MTNSVVERANGNGKVEQMPQKRPRPSYRLLGKSVQMRKLRDQLHRVAATDATVLLQGESGTGKEVTAHLLHQWSRRGGQPFVVVNCSGLAEGVLESELFGHEEGAFSGASRLRRGAFETGHTGTVFLDEMGTASQAVQLRLLRVIENWEVQRVGSNKLVPVDVRLIVSSNVPLIELVKGKAFREDLFHRINVVELTLPPLRDRRDDIEELSATFLAEAALNNMQEVPVLSAETRAVLSRYTWPGNVRQLKHVMERASVLDMDGIIGLDDLPGYVVKREMCVREGNDSSLIDRYSGTLREAVSDFEETYMVRILEQCQGNVTKASERLGMSRKSLYTKIEKYGIQADDFREEGA